MMTTLLNNRYQTIQVLGVGGFSETFLAEDTYLPSRRRCVIKQMKPLTNEPQMYQLTQQRFEREAATLEALGEGSDQIPKLFAYFSENGQFYLAQEWIQGQTLREIVRSQGQLSETAVRDMLVSLLSLLDYVHSKSIIHRDIKPDNIIVRQSNGKPVLIDFGALKETIATTVNSQGKPQRSIIVGTPGFMSPEQGSGRPVYASDLYSLGLTAIFLLTGKRPQELETDLQTDEIIWQQHAPNVSPSLAGVLNKAIQYHPRDRYTTAIKMLDALQSAASIPPPPPPTEARTLDISPDAEQVSSQPVTAISPPIAPLINHRPGQENWSKPLILGGLLAASLIGVTLGFGLIGRQQQPESSIITSPSPSPFPAESTTPAVKSSKPALKSTDTPSASVMTETPSPTTDVSTPQPENTVQTPQSRSDGSVPQSEKQPITQAPSPTNSAPQQNNNRNNSGGNVLSKRVPGFPVGTSQTRVKAVLGNPTRSSRGYFPNTRALLYELESGQITLGYIFDRNSANLRQTEVAFAQSVDLEVMQVTLQGMLGVRSSANINQGLQRVYQRRANNYSFNIGGLKGVIQRNNRDRIYIGVWEADLH